MEKEKVTCSVCGKEFSKSGVIGHMRFKHGKDPKAPMFDLKKPIGYGEARMILKIVNSDEYKSPCCSAPLVHNKGSFNSGIYGIFDCTKCSKEYALMTNPISKKNEFIETRLISVPVLAPESVPVKAKSDSDKPLKIIKGR